MITIGSNLELQSQTTDTICAPVAQMKKVYAAAAQKKVADSLLVIAEKQVAELNNQITLLDGKNAEQKAMCDNQLELLYQEISLYKDQIQGYEKLLRKERRKRFFTTAGGLLTTGLMAFLFIQK